MEKLRANMSQWPAAAVDEVNWSYLPLETVSVRLFQSLQGDKNFDYVAVQQRVGGYK